MTLLRLAAGVIRDGRAVVSGVCEGSGFGEIDIVAMGTAGRELRRARLADCAVPDGAEGFRASLALDGFEAPVKGIYFASPDPAFGMEAAAGYELTSLFYETEEEYERSGFGRKRILRPRDKETDAFLSRQLAEAYAGALPDRLLMVMSYAYRSIEIGSAADIAHALELLDGIGRRQSEFRPDAEPRKDATHLRTSILTTRWHAELALGRFAEFRATLEALLEQAVHVMVSPLAFYTSTNAIRGLVVLSALRLMTGDHDGWLAALDVAWKVLRFAGMGLRDDESGLVEFAGSCRLVGLMAPHRRRLLRRPGAPLGEQAIADLETRILLPAFRTSSPRALLEAFRRAVEAGV